MNYKKVEEYILEKPGVSRSYADRKHLVAYTVDGEMFALMEVNKRPIRLSLRCDKRLANLLKERYEEIMPGHKLHKDKWITIVLSGQLESDEVLDLITHSYELVQQENS